MSNNPLILVLNCGSSSLKGAVLDVVRPHLTAREWDKLMAGLGMAGASLQ